MVNYAKLAAELAAGTITADRIQSLYGDYGLSSVLAIGSGVGAAAVTSVAIDFVEKQTGLVSDINSVIEDIFDFDLF